MRTARIKPDTYVDSVLLMGATRAMRDAEGVTFAAALMGTRANLDDLVKEGFDEEALVSVGANDLVLAVEADPDQAAGGALDAAEATLSERKTDTDAGTQGAPKTIEDAVARLPGANTAIVSVPGDYAALAAHHALSAGLNVLLFSDNVSVEDEVTLKERAATLGLLVMGPGAGTAILGGTGLGFANAVRRGRIGVVAAAGTGAQEVSTLIDRCGAGVRQLVGVGGRDLSEAVGGRMTCLALDALERDDETDVMLLVSKPPSAGVAADILSRPRRKPLVAALIGLDEEVPTGANVRLATTMDGSVTLALEEAGGAAPEWSDGLDSGVEDAVAATSAGRTTVRGLFSGGTLCYEAMVVISSRLGPVHSNTPLRKEWALPAPDGAHVCLDLGEEEYTKGRPHPMIDPEPRAEKIAEAIENPSVAVILIDVVLGYGSHPDPASVLAPVCKAATKPGGPAVVAYVLGTTEDPQSSEDQSRALADVGCILAPTGARAALFAAAIAGRDPKLVKEIP